MNGRKHKTKQNVMERCTVMESFFLEESALIPQVQWLQNKIRLSDSFFVKFLKVEEHVFCKWKTKEENIPVDMQDHLKGFWQTILHILSFQNFDLERVRLMFNNIDKSDSGRSGNLPFAPPWIGTSMKFYLETNGSAGIQKVNKWVQDMRFGDSF